MKRTGLSSLILALFLLSGCATTHEYKGNILPSFSSGKYASFGPISPINDGIKINIPAGSGTTKYAIKVFPINGKETNTLLKIEVDWNWNISYKDNNIYNHHVFGIEADLPTAEKRTFKIEMDCIHDSTGKEIKFDILVDDTENGTTSETLEEAKKEMSVYITNLISNFGKKVRSGDIVNIGLGPMMHMSGNTIQAEVSQIIKGQGIYKNRKVIVTEYIYEDKIQESEALMEDRMKGYNLYDSEAFILLFGEGTMFGVGYHPKEGTLLIKGNIEITTDNVFVQKIIDSPNSKEVKSTEKTFKHSDWHETKEKIKALGELLEKGLITKEEYENKKRELLKNF